MSAIIHTAENPSAVVYGKLVREGDTVRGYKVLKIHKDKVELQKDGEITVKRAF